MKRQREEIQAIYLQPSAPTFDNTIAALDRSGALLDRVNNVFHAMESSMTNDGIQALSKEIAPQLSQHRDEILLNDRLFQRVKAVNDVKDKLNLTAEQKKLLEETYKDFVRGGANLPPAEKHKLTEINSQLSVLSVKFGENVLKENNRFELVIEDKGDLAGLPDTVIAAAAEAGKERGHDGKWVFTLHKPSMIPFLQYCAEPGAVREDLSGLHQPRQSRRRVGQQERFWPRWPHCVSSVPSCSDIPRTAHYVLEENMAKVPDNVYKLLNQVWPPALKRAKQEVADMQQIIDGENGRFKLASWDWWYYAERVKKAKYDLDEEMLRPYFKLENVLNGVFDVAGRLYGLHFKKRTDIPVYHEDVTAFEVQDADGKHIGILFVDYFPRASKRGGAWMSEFRRQHMEDGKDIRPVIYNVGNFSKPTADKPSLLSLEEVETLFHEFGHGLHGLLSHCTYKTLAGTEVARDFVELPSQIMENWAIEPAVLKMYARHYETGDTNPRRVDREDSQCTLFQPRVRHDGIPGGFVSGHGLAHDDGAEA